MTMSDRFNIRVLILLFLRTILAVISAGTLACHIAQTVLISRDDTIPSTESWWPEYRVYILYYAGAGFSLLSSLLLILGACVRQTVRGDRILSVINAAFLIAIIVYATLKAGSIPWVGQDGETIDAQKGFMVSCSAYSAISTVTFQRCWLQNGTWLGLIILVGFWIILALFLFVLRSSSIYPKEDFMPVLTAAAFAMPADEDNFYRPHSPVNQAQSGSPMISYTQNTPITGAYTPPLGGAYNPAYQQPSHINHTNYFNMPPLLPYQPNVPLSNNDSPSHGPSSAIYRNTDDYGQYNQGNNYEEKTAASASPSPVLSASQPPHSYDKK